MITDEIMEAVDKMIGGCTNLGRKHGIEMVREMLAEFDEDSWLNMNEGERCGWIGMFTT